LFKNHSLALTGASKDGSLDDTVLGTPFSGCEKADVEIRIPDLIKALKNVRGSYTKQYLGFYFTNYSTADFNTLSSLYLYPYDEVA
jgi:hypothetical protein